MRKQPLTQDDEENEDMIRQLTGAFCSPPNGAAAAEEEEEYPNTTSEDSFEDDDTVVGGGRHGNDPLFTRLLTELENDEFYLQGLTDEEKGNVIHGIAASVVGGSGKSLLVRLLETPFPSSTLKRELLKRYCLHASSPKNTQWLETVMRIPFGRSADPVTLEDIKNAQVMMDGIVYGHQEAKHKLMSYFAQLFRNSNSNGMIIGLHSYPGVGKTNLIDGCFSKIIHRPFFSTSLAGASSGEFLRGFHYTFEGSEPGYMTRSIISAGVMNPVFFFDELDKVSKTAQGDEIINCLTQLTDPLQSKVFQDRYLGETVTLDLSRCTFVFAYNDKSLLNPILRDRITEIELKGFSPEDKLIIAREFLVPRLISQIGFPIDAFPSMTDRAIMTCINRYTNEAGVRHLNRILSEILMEVNLKAILFGDPYGKIDDWHMEHYLYTFKPISIEKCISIPILGKVNGLFVDSQGSSGILPLEAAWIPSVKKASSFELRYTGNLGLVMGESARVAWSVAWNLLEEKRREEWTRTWSGLQGNNRGCLHVHCRDNAVPKDGPSAGVALTVLMWSMLMERPIPQDTAYTGEISLDGSLLPIGGLAEKLIGAHRAGCAKVFIPKFNADILIPPQLKIISVSTIQQVLKLIESDL